MTHFATLITSPATVSIPDAVVASAVSALPHPGAPTWLAPGVAVDVPFSPPTGSDDTRWAQAVRAALGGAPVDVVVQAAGGRRKRLLVADMDSTLIEQECIDELADAVGLRAAVSDITARSMQGALAFEAALVERVALLRGLDVAVATRVTDRLTLMPGARTLVRTMRAHGATVAIASGGFTMFTAHVAHLLGADHHYANTLEVAGGRLTGAVREPIFGRAGKRTVLRTLRDELGIAPGQTLAVGDGANDLAMLEEAGLGVAYRAKPAVSSVARARIEHGDLTALLYIQGYAAGEFTA